MNHIVYRYLVLALPRRINAAKVTVFDLACARLLAALVALNQIAASSWCWRWVSLPAQ
ncbi:MAG: hypothetical protein IPG05_04965 [Gemmatimonadetes bacterium]|nr:hypothetical protein [Gemmatimonadota bacterium]